MSLLTLPYGFLSWALRCGFCNRMQSESSFYDMKKLSFCRLQTKIKCKSTRLFKKSSCTLNLFWWAPYFWKWIYISMSVLFETCNPKVLRHSLLFIGICVLFVFQFMHSKYSQLKLWILFEKQFNYFNKSLILLKHTILLLQKFWYESVMRLKH